MKLSLLRHFEKEYGGHPPSFGYFFPAQEHSVSPPQKCLFTPNYRFGV